MDAATRDRLQAQELIGRGLLPPERVQQAAGSPHRQAGEDLCGLLQRHGLLQPEAAQAIRQAVLVAPTLMNSGASFHLAPASGGAPSFEARLTIVPGQAPQFGSERRPGEVPPLATRTGAGERAAAARHYEQIADADPLFAPHAERCLARLSKLGEGGMGTVYRVEDRRLGREAALKVMLPESADAAAVARFLREAKITASLDHPAIPPVYEVGTNTAGEHFMLMKVIEGETLGARIAAVHASTPEPGAIRELLSNLLRVAEAIAYAHSRRVIHRDLKPENVMLGAFGQVMVLDWGLARRQDDEPEPAPSPGAIALAREAGEAGLTMAGAMLGTPGYMAPEQTEGLASERSDVFALGVMLTELVSGGRAVEGNTAINRISATIKGEIRQPRELNRQAPRALDSLARAATTLDPAERLPSAAEFSEELRRFLDGEKLEVHQYNLSERFSRWASAHPMALIGTSLALILFLTLGLLERSLLRSDKARGLAENRANSEQAQREKLSKSVALFNEAELLERRGAPKKAVTAKLNQALQLDDRSEGGLLSAARILLAGRHRDTARRYLEEAVTKHPPGYQALVLLGRIERKSSTTTSFTPSFKKLLRIAEERGEEALPAAVIARAVKALVESDYARALELLEPLCASSPSPVAELHRASALYGLDRLQESIEAASASLSLSPLLYGARVARAKALARLGQFKRARLDLTIAIRLYPTEPLLFIQRANLSLQAGQPLDALVDCDVASVLCKKAPIPWLHIVRAQAFLARHRVNEALRSIGEALNLDRKNASAYAIRGKIRIESGDLTGAAADLKQSLSLDPQNRVAIQTRAELHRRKGDNAYGLASLDEEVRRHPKDPEVYYRRGVFKRRIGDPRGALTDLDATLKLRPAHPRALGQRGVVLFGLNRRGPALKSLAAAVRADSRDAMLHSWYAKVLAAGTKKEQTKALEELDAAIRLDGENYEHYRNRASLNVHLARPKAAMKDINQALNCSSGNPSLLHLRGLLYARAGDRKRAAADFRAALSLNPKHPRRAQMERYLAN